MVQRVFRPRVLGPVPRDKKVRKNVLMTVQTETAKCGQIRGVLLAPGLREVAVRQGTDREEVVRQLKLVGVWIQVTSGVRVSIVDGGDV